MLDQFSKVCSDMKKETGSAPVLFIDEADLLFTFFDNKGEDKKSYNDNHYLKQLNCVKAFQEWCIEQSCKEANIKIVMASSNGFFADMINASMASYHQVIIVNDLPREETETFIKEIRPEISKEDIVRVADMIGGRIGDLISVLSGEDISIDDNLKISGLIERTEILNQFGLDPSYGMYSLSDKENTESPLWSPAQFWYIMERMVENGGSISVNSLPRRLFPTKTLHHMISYNLINIFGGMVYPNYPFMLHIWKETRKIQPYKFTYRVKVGENHVKLVSISEPTLQEFKKELASKNIDYGNALLVDGFEIETDQAFFCVKPSNMITIKRRDK